MDCASLFCLLRGRHAPLTTVGSGGLDTMGVRATRSPMRKAHKPPPALGTVPVGSEIEHESKGARR